MKSVENFKQHSKRQYEIYCLGLASMDTSNGIFKPDSLQFYTDDKKPQYYTEVIGVDCAWTNSETADFTAIIKCLFDYKEDVIYIDEIRCNKFDNPVEMVKAVSAMCSDDTSYLIVDGWGNQEKNFRHILSNSGIKMSSARIVATHNKIDTFLPNAALFWHLGKVRVNYSIKNTLEGREFLMQCYGFKSKLETDHKAGEHDDAPDALINTMMYLAENKGYGKTLLREMN
jgi:hypothetical protein